ncbi:MAG: site-specific integrase [Solirubrobacteraceae bacterium]|nr:site-specific integrase [Solirubrobacteraceae bacterium]
METTSSGRGQMAPRSKRKQASGGRPANGSIEVRPFKNGADASFWLHVTVDGERRSRRLGRASEGWTPVLAEAERRRVVEEIAAGIYREPTPELPLEERDPTFHLWASRWLAQRAPEIEKKTYDQYEYLLRRQLLPFFHAYRLTQITYRVVDEFKKRKIDEMRRIQAAARAGVTLRHADGRPMALSPKTINHAIDLLSAILGAATRDEELDVQVNPADDRRLRVKIPKRSARDFLEADEVLTLLVAGEIVDNPVKPETARAAAEVRRLRDVDKLPWREIARRMERSEGGVIWLYERQAVRCASPSRAVVALLAASGVCNTEACDLRWSDVDFTHGKINVSRSKTNRGVREIDMIPWLREELLSFRAAVGTPDLNAPVFPTRTGAPRTKDSLNRNVTGRVGRAATALRADRGLPPLPVAVTAHTFRRTFVTLMLEAGAPLTYVQDQVGHEDTKTTQEIYARVLRRQQRAKVGKAFNELMYGARELAVRAEEQALRTDGHELLMESPFEPAPGERG